MQVEGMLVGRTCTIGNTVTPPWTSPAYVLVTNEGHTVSQLSGHDANQHRRWHVSTNQQCKSVEKVWYCLLWPDLGGIWMAPHLWNWENHSYTLWRGRIYRVVRFFHPRSTCTTHLMLFSERPPIYASSCMMISGERTEQLDIFCRVTGFTSNFRLPQTSADICIGHDYLGWKNRTTRCNMFSRVDYNT